MTTKKAKRDFLPEVFATIGFGVLCYGAWCIFEPAGFLVGGALLLTVGVLMRMPKKPKR